MVQLGDSLQTEVEAASAREASAYLAGAVRDATFNRLHRTMRFSQNDRGWLEVVSLLLQKVGAGSWIYREGRDRSVWALETTWSPSPILLAEPEERVAFIRGYFDAEGGCPRAAEARFYLQFVQKNRPDLEHVRTLLVDLGVACGRLHNPSYRVDPDYWRFYIRAESQARFVADIGSWHPRKRSRFALQARPVSTISP